MEENNNEFEFIDYSEPDEQYQTPRRTTILLILCILTIINSGWCCLSYLVMPLVKPMMDMDIMMKTYESFMDAALLEKMEQSVHFMLTIANWKFIILSMAYILAIIGAALMLKVRKIGLYFYIIAQVGIIIILSFVIGGYMRMTVHGILFSLLWIGLYIWQMQKSIRGE